MSAALMVALRSKAANDWAMYSIVAKHNITEKMHLMLQHDHGFADGVIGVPTALPMQNGMV